MNSPEAIGFGPRLENRAAILRRPRFWLAAQMAAILVVSGVTGLLHRQLFTDSEGYIAVSNLPLREALGSQRALGYPLLLKAVGVVSPDYSLVPWVHLTMLFAATSFLDAAMRRFGASPWQAMAVASGAMYGAIQQSWWIPAILTDLAGLVLAVTSVGFLLWTVVEPKRFATWCGLVLSIAAAYQVRPVYLFLIPLVPCLGMLLFYLRVAGTERALQWKGVLVGLIAASTIPYVSFCLFRLAVVGHFGLVSFGGYTVSGLAVELLDPAVIETELPERFRPLARDIVEKRKELGIRPAFRGGLRLDMWQWERNYIPNVYWIALPAAGRIYGEDRTRQNRELLLFAREVFRLQKARYLLWLSYDIPRAVAKVLYRSWFTWLFAPVALGLCVIRRRIVRCPEDSRTTARVRGSRVLFWAVSWIAFLFFVATIGLVVLSGVGGDSRNVVPAGVFVPSVILLVIVHEATTIYESRCRNCDCST